MSTRLTPLPMTTLVTTDLIGITRGRSFSPMSLSIIKRRVAAGCRPTAR